MFNCRSTASRSDDLSRTEDPNKKKGRRGRGKNSDKSSGSSGRREEPVEPERPSTVYAMDEDATDIPTSKKRKSSSTSNIPPPSKKPAEDGTLSFAQLKAQMDAKKAAENLPTSSSVLPAHMFGNALNPASSMAQRMVDTLSQEIETIAEAGVSLDTVEKPVDKLVGFPVPKFSSPVSSSSNTNGLTNGTTTAINGLSSQLSNGGSVGTTAASNGARAILEQLLEKQWEQGSQFLMEQAQHLDIAQLLSCLNQLKQDNRALEDHISSLLQRKDQLQALNARLSIPLSTTLSINNGPAIPPPFSTPERSPHDLPRKAANFMLPL